MDTDNWLNWNGVMHNPNERKDDWEIAVEFDIGLDNGIENPECPEQWDLSAVPNFPELIKPIRRLMKTTGKGLLTFSAMASRRNKKSKIK